MTMQFVIVRDADKRAGDRGDLPAVLRRLHPAGRVYIGSIDKGSADANAQQRRSASSADYLGEHMGEAPVLIIPCTIGRIDGQPGMMAASDLGNVLPAMWSLMLAARARGLGTCWTTLHLMQEQAVAEIVGIPVRQRAAAVPQPAGLHQRAPTSSRPSGRSRTRIIHWDTW